MFKNKKSVVSVNEIFYVAQYFKNASITNRKIVEV